jgi:hypothetical protein
MGSLGSAPYVLSLSTIWKRVVSFTPRPLYPRRNSSNAHCTEAGWAPESIWTLWRRNKSLSLLGINPHFFGIPTCSLVTNVLRLRLTYLIVVVIIRLVDYYLYCPRNITAVLPVGETERRGATDVEHCPSVDLSLMKTPVQLVYARRQHQSTVPEH